MTFILPRGGTVTVEAQRVDNPVTICALMDVALRRLTPDEHRVLAKLFDALANTQTKED